MKLIKKITRKIKKIRSKILDNLRPFIRYQNYLGYKLYYSKGTSLIQMIDKKTSLYEPDTCEILKSLIKVKKSPTFIDIGSNIGLISLYMLKNIPDILIYAFDPGPHQSMLFRKTIDKNNINDRIKLFETALSDKNGETVFCIHNSKDVSGDGFKDTGKAGKYKEIIINTKKLDQWWIENNKPQIDLIKIDTEGAELYVLAGGRELFKTCTPKVYFEMHPSLYTKYDYSHLDILNFFNSINYIVYSTDNQIVTNTNIHLYLGKYSNYYATLK